MAEDEGEIYIPDKTTRSSDSLSPERSRGEHTEQISADQNASEEVPLTVSALTQEQLRNLLRKKDDPKVLQPDNPLLNRFQASLKIHLERQNSRLTEEVLELESVLKDKGLERENVGVMLYDMQQEVSKQFNTLETYNDQLTSMTENRQKIERELVELKQQYKDTLGSVSRAENKELQFQSTLRHLVIMERQFQEWEEEMDSELAVAHRVSEKGKIDRRQLTEDKRQQDIFVYKLTSEVTNLEAKNAMLTGQIQQKEKDQLIIGQTIADANSDLEALNREQRRLLKAWNSVLSTLRQKDNIYSDMSKQRILLDEELLNIKTEIGSYKTASRQKMEENENVTQVLNRMKFSADALLCQYMDEEKKIEGLEKEISEKSAIIQQIDRKFQEVNGAYNKLYRDCSSLRDEIQKHLIEKAAMQDRILEHFENQKIHKNASKYMSKRLQETRDLATNHNQRLVSEENKYAKYLYDIEIKKGIVYRNQKKLNDLEQDLTERDKELGLNEVELNRTISLVCKKQGIVDNLAKKLEAIIDKAGGEELSPLEIKIISLQKSLVEIGEKIEKQQQFWLRQEGHIINLTQQRNEQLQETDFIRKQGLILDQKNLKIEHEIERHNKEAEDVSRSISKLLHKLVDVNTKLNERRGYKENLDKDNFSTQTEYINVLKDAEMESLNLQAELVDLEQEKIQLTETLLRTHQESLAWEKKVLLALEIKQNINKEKSKEGGVGALKSRIHRMHARYSQLSRIQEKLIHDLEHCVSRRDAIVDLTEAREKKSIKGTHNTQVSFQKRLDDLRNTIKQVTSEMKSVDHLIDKREEEKETLLKQITEKRTQFEQCEEVLCDINNQLEEGKLLKQGNFELLVRRQRTVRMYEDLKAGRYKLLFRDHTALDYQLLKHRLTNDNLILVLFSLLKDFPSLRIPLSKIMSTLHSYTS